MRERLECGDCLEVMKTIESGSVDMVLCDLPYGVLNRGNKHSEWDKVIPPEKLWEQWGRICKPKAAIVLFGQGMFTARMMASNEAWWRYNMVWDKCRTSGFLNAKRQPLRCHEDIMVFYKEQCKYNPQMEKVEPWQRSHSRGKQENKTANRCYGEVRIVEENISDFKYPRTIVKMPAEHKCEKDRHPTQKPIALCEYLIKTFTDVGDVVMDCTMGSGTTCVAAINTGRGYIGIEKKEEYFKTAERRCAIARIEF